MTIPWPAEAADLDRSAPRKGVVTKLFGVVLIFLGALDAMVVDYQCIMPSVTDVAQCFHTEIISTADKARFAGATHVSFDPRRGLEIGKHALPLVVRRVQHDRHLPDGIRHGAG